jgi:hypothetical protein
MRQELLIVGLLLAALGCNSDPSCRRETALLRAEILDLEDKYYVTKAQRDEALAALQGQGKTDIATKISKRSPISQLPASNEIYLGEAHEGLILSDPQSTVIGPSNIIETNQGTIVPYSSDIIYDDLQLPGQPGEMTPVPNGIGQPAIKGTTPGSPQAAENIFRESTTGEARAAGESILTPADAQPRTNGGSGAGGSGAGGSGAGGSGAGADEALPSPSPGTNASGREGAGRSSPNSRLRQANQSKTRRSIGSPAGAVTEILAERQPTDIRSDDFASTSLGLLVKTLDANGNARRTSGSLTVSIVDPFASSPETPLGNWKFLPNEVELFFTDPDSEPGIQLSLPLEQGLPQGKYVVVKVRLQTPDGRALETTARIPTEKSKIQIDQGEDDLLAEGEKASRPAWRPVR